MSILVTDLTLARRLNAERDQTEAAKHDEVWEGVRVMSPLANNEHQVLASQLVVAVAVVMQGTPVRATVLAGANVSDREAGWEQNYREPDVPVFLEGGQARDCGTHWLGGPDFAVEILSPNDRAREKLPFYAKIGVRDLMIIDRDPWALELLRLRDGQLAMVGRSTPERPDVLVSEVLPFTFHLAPGEGRPRVEVSRQDGRQSWMA